MSTWTEIYSVQVPTSSLLTNSTTVVARATPSIAATLLRVLILGLATADQTFLKPTFDLQVPTTTKLALNGVTTTRDTFISTVGSLYTIAAGADLKFYAVSETIASGVCDTVTANSSAAQTIVSVGSANATISACYGGTVATNLKLVFTE